ncbi:MAG: hypothetical protein SLAVMIC_00230 [uncultured marine phage]|uniref:Uncharacterized protein n=1 Tax=uncultured marine phage TaxID=707152 RepID=A0A8D9C8K1_9VIRU|nr:MAG: hypothetical protein SLAVMIC_00230 [uncultured marine phage]
MSDDKDKEKKDEEKLLSYKRKYFRKKRPFLKWFFLKRKDGDDSDHNKVTTLIMFIFIIIFNLLFLWLDTVFCNFGWGLNALLTYISGSAILISFDRYMASVNKSGSTFVNFFTNKWDKENVLNMLGISGILYGAYMCWMFILILSAFIVPYAGLIIGTMCQYIMSSLLNYLMQIEHDVDNKEVGKHSIREMRLKEILGNG